MTSQKNSASLADCVQTTAGGGYESLGLFDPSYCIDFILANSSGGIQLTTRVFTLFVTLVYVDLVQ